MVSWDLESCVFQCSADESGGGDFSAVEDSPYAKKGKHLSIANGSVTVRSDGHDRDGPQSVSR